MGPAPQVFQAEVQVPCQMLYQQAGATQPCCPHYKQPSINYLQVQRETPTWSQAGPYRAAPGKTTPPPKLSSAGVQDGVQDAPKARGMERVGTPDQPLSAISSAEGPRGSEFW